MISIIKVLLSKILEIFSDRAVTKEGVLQVEMAALTYQRSRLVRAWTHLERQRGGLGFVGGPGETQIESDKRAIDSHLVRLKRQLEKIKKTKTISHLPLIKQSRLSVMPIDFKSWKIIYKMGKIKPN